MLDAHRNVRDAIRYDNATQVWYCWGQRSGKLRVMSKIGIPEFVIRSRTHVTKSLVVSSNTQDIGYPVLADATLDLSAQGYGTTQISGGHYSWGNSSGYTFDYDALLNRHKRLELPRTYDAIFLDELDWQTDGLLCLRTAKSILKPGGLLFVSSSPQKKDGVVLTSIAALEGVPGVHLSHLSTWEVDPSITRDTLPNRDDFFSRDFAAFRRT